MSVDQQIKAKADTLSPLWIIALFLSFTETVLGVAAVKTGGLIQITLTIFVLLFPTAISAVFFTILWRRPFVFYPPREFGPNTTVDRYVNAMRDPASDERSVKDLVTEQIEKTLESEAVRSRLKSLSRASQAQEPEAEKDVVRYISSALEAGIKTVFVQVDSTPLLRNSGRKWEVSYDPGMS